MRKKFISVLLMAVLLVSSFTPINAYGVESGEVLKFNASIEKNPNASKEIAAFTESKFNNGRKVENVTIDADIHLGEGDAWSINGRVVGLEDVLDIYATGFYNTKKLKNGKQMYYGALLNLEKGMGIYIYYIPEQNKKLMTLNITLDNHIANFTFGRSFKEIEEVVELNNEIQENLNEVNDDSIIEIEDEPLMSVLTTSTWSIRGASEVFLSGRRVGTLLLAGERDGLGRDHENATHTISSKDNLHRSWEAMYPNWIVQRPNVIEVETGILMPTDYSHRLHTPKQEDTRISFGFMYWLPMIGWSLGGADIVTQSINVHQASVNGTNNLIEWRMRKNSGFSDYEVDSAANSRGLVGYFVSSYRGLSVRTMNVSAFSRITYQITRRDTATWNIVTDVYVTPRMNASYSHTTSIN